MKFNHNKFKITKYLIIVLNKNFNTTPKKIKGK